jgi:hypothetical protein
MPIVSPAKAQIITKATGSATLKALLAGGAQNGHLSVFPQAIVEPTATTAAPFIVLRMGSNVAVDRFLQRLTWTWYVYAEPYDQYWSIDPIVRVLRDLYDGMALTHDAWGVAEYTSTSDELADDAWGKRFKFARFQVLHI